MRNLSVRVGAGVLAAIMLFSSVACNTSWVNEALQIVSAVTPAISGIVPLIALADSDVSAADIASIQTLSNQASTAIQTTGSLIDQYNKATTDAAKQDILSKIEAGLIVAQNNLNTILPQLHVKDKKLQAALSAAVGVIIAEVGSLAALLPVLKAGHAADAVALARPLSARQFRSRYNGAINPIPGSGKLKLKGYSWLSGLGNGLGNAVGEWFVNR